MGLEQIDGAPSKLLPLDPRGGDAGMLLTKEGCRGRILTKKERKKLAQEKARQLEEMLLAAHEGNNAASGNAAASANNIDEPGRKKSKKRKGGSDGQNVGNSNGTATPLFRPTSLTGKRRLNGRLIVSDVLLGAGVPVRPGKRISLHYTGSLRSNGEVFDRNNSKQHPLIFCQGTGEVIRGEKSMPLPVCTIQNIAHHSSDKLLIYVFPPFLTGLECGFDVSHLERYCTDIILACLTKVRC
jgi:FKBP-type peptidyl-prolyl cis-trans isomerase